MQAQEVDEGTTARLRCELSREGASVEWRKGSLQLFPCAKYQMVQEGRTAELLVRGAEPEDSGQYTCDAGDSQSTASLSIRGELPSSALPSSGPLVLQQAREGGALLGSPKRPSLAPQPLGPYSGRSCRARSRRPAVWPGCTAS